MTPNSNSKAIFTQPARLAVCDDDDLADRLIETRAFQRLRSIRFLGAIDYVLVRAPNGTGTNVRHTRYQHSIGVAKLAMDYAAYVGLDQADRRLACAAALLHDVGHSPLSHSLEPIFKETFGMDHHRATQDVVTGRALIGTEIWEVLKAFRLDPEQIVGVLNGADDPCAGFFTGPINFDTIEGITRTRRYATQAVSGLTSRRVVRAATDRSNENDQDAVDSFWDEKNDVYARIIRSREGVLSDHLVQSLARRHISRFKASDYFVTETTLFTKLPEIRDALKLGLERGIREHRVAYPTAYDIRSFYVDRNCSFYLREDAARYRQTKSVMAFANAAGQISSSANVQLELPSGIM